MYRSEIVETSMTNMSKVEQIAMKDVGDCILLETYVNENDGEVIIEPKDYALLHVENDRSESKEYDVLILVDSGGTKFKTGSQSFFNAFMDIYNDLKDETGWSIKVYGKPSKNYNGKNFLTCSVVIQ